MGSNPIGVIALASARVFRALGESCGVAKVVNGLRR